MRKEVEVKVKVSDFGKVKQQLTEMGCVFSQQITQDDVTFVDSNYGEYDEFQPGKNILRLRKSDDKYIFTLKQPQRNEMDSIERESEISDPEEFEAALLLMGYRKVVKIHKTRVKTKYKDCEICLDEVEGLGSFIEVEKIITGDGDAIEVQEQLFEFLITLGIDPKDQVFNGYDTLIYRKNKNA
jgi:adenylate cyclase class 2